MARRASGMVPRFGPVVAALGLRRRLQRIEILDESADRVRLAIDRGPCAFVLLRRSRLDYMALNAVLIARSLPLSVFAPGISTWWWQPLAQLFKTRRGPVDARWMADAVASGQPITVFLLGAPARPDPWQALLDLQASSDAPVQLLPVMVFWDRAPDRPVDPVRQFLLGSRDRPSLLTRWRNLLTRARNTFVQVGEPLDLAELSRRVPHERRVAAAQTLLRRYLKREAKVVRGPRLLPAAVMRRLVLDNPPMRSFAEEEAARRGLTPTAVRAEMEREYDRIAAHFRWWVAMLGHFALRPLWTRVFSGVDVLPEDAQLIRDAMRAGSVVLVPCHKSHFDYVLLSWVFYDQRLIVPHVVAGVNLSIVGVSFFLRSLGGFFVRRRFGDDQVHPTVFARYLRELVHQEYPVEFFIEGGRTRTGRLMRPRLGVLEMVLDAAAMRAHGREVTVLPLAFAYEQVAEEAAYLRELGGGAKKAESLGQVARASSVYGRRYGRVYLRVGAPLTCSSVVDATGDRPDWLARPESERREELEGLGARIVDRIGAVMMVLPSSLVALALVAHHRRGIHHDELVARCERLRDLLDRKGAHLTGALADVGGRHRLEAAVAGSLTRFERQGLVAPLEHEGGRVWAIVPETRLALAFSANQVLHLLAPAGLAAAALRGLPDAPQAPEALRPGFATLLHTLRRQLVFDPERTDDDLLREGLADLEHHGAIAREDGSLAVVDAARVGEVYALFRPLLETLTLVLAHAGEVASVDPAVVGRTLHQDAERWHREGAASRPEALAVVDLSDSVRSLLEDGVLVAREGRLQPSRAAEALAALLQPMVA